MGDNCYSSYHISYSIDVFDDTVVKDGQVTTFKSRSKVVLQDIVDTTVQKAIATHPAISSWAELSKVLHERMQILMIVCCSFVWISFLIEPVKVNMPNSLVSKLTSQSICWLNSANLERRRRLDDCSHWCESTSSDEYVTALFSLNNDDEKKYQSDFHL